MGLLLKPLELLAGLFGVNLTVVAAVVGTLGGGVVGGTGGYFIGRAIGYNQGVAVADKQAELNDAQRRLDELRRDKEASDQAAQSARADAEDNARLKEEADAKVKAYAAAIKARAAVGGCDFDDDDLAVLQNNVWGKKRDGQRAQPARR